MGRPAKSASATVADSAAPKPSEDRLGRPLRSLRVSLIDMCNLRCNYCMPEEEYAWLPREDILSPEEIGRLVGIFTELGVDKVRLTGGEPLMRREVEQVIQHLSGNPRIRDLSLTTNGVLLERHADRLARAGLQRITVSLDTLRPDRFEQLTGRDQLEGVIAGIDAAAGSGLSALKINTVVMRGYNDDELIDLIEFGKERNAEIRFIEYMDVGGATQWSMATVVSQREILDTLGQHYGSPQPLSSNGTAPAERFVLPDGTSFGIIASTTEPFCRTCDRSRVTADGLWFLCLYAEQGIDLRTPLRDQASDDVIKELILSGWTAREDRGAEDRKTLNSRGPLYQIEDLRQDPHREMHTRGG